MRSYQKAIGATLILMCVGSTASAATILDINNANDYGINLNDGFTQVTGTFFTLTESYTNVSISAPISCVACTGTAVLHSGSLGPGATPADLVAGMNFSASLSSLFSGLSLGRGTFTLLAGVTSGTGGWSGSAAPVTTSDGNSSDGFDLVSEVAEFYIPGSAFVPTFSTSQLAYTISGDIVPPVTNVPLPAPAGLLLSGLFGLTWLRRKQGRVGTTNSRVGGAHSLQPEKQQSR